MLIVVWSVTALSSWVVAPSGVWSWSSVGGAVGVLHLDLRFFE